MPETNVAARDGTGHFKEEGVWEKDPLGELAEPNFSTDPVSN